MRRSVSVDDVELHERSTSSIQNEQWTQFNISGASNDELIGLDNSSDQQEEGFFNRKKWNKPNVARTAVSISTFIMVLLMLILLIIINIQIFNFIGSLQRYIDDPELISELFNPITDDLVDHFSKEIQGIEQMFLNETQYVKEKMKEFEETNERILYLVYQIGTMCNNSVSTSVTGMYN